MEPLEAEIRQELAARLERELRPLMDIRHGDWLEDGTPRRGYNCCGCSTYDLILDDAIAIVLGTPVQPKDTNK